MDYSRQLGLIDPGKIINKSISLVGVGATGSYVALQLAQLGWGNASKGQGVLRVFDHDVVEGHNLANQIYEKEHIGMAKVEALKGIILRKCGFEIEAHNEMVTDQQSVQSTYVFLLTDTMASRKEIFEKCLRRSIRTDLVVETRMGLRGGRVYAFNPNNPDQREEWLNTLYDDDVAEASRCGASASIITTVMFLASMAAGRAVHHFNTTYGSDTLTEEGQTSAPKLWNEVQFTLYPESFYMRRFGEEAVMMQPVG